MNYRHAYHAGNHTEMLKHGALVLALAHLRLKDKPFFLLDTHAGIGLTDLASEEALKTREADGGIRLVQRAAPAALAAYLEIVAAVAEEHGADVFPGSPEIARRLLRADDRLVACELHPADVEVLRANLGRDPRVAVHYRDGFEALGAFVPPPERRGLVLIDPPYEKRDDPERLGRALAKALRKWPTGTYLAWYPLKAPDASAAILAPLAGEDAPPILRVELRIRPFDCGLVGGGLVVINPPWTMPDALDAMGEALLDAFDARSGGAYAREWIVPPR